MVSRQNKPTIRGSRANARWNKCRAKIALRTFWSLALVLLVRRQSILEDLSLAQRHPSRMPMPIPILVPSGSDARAEAIQSAVIVKNYDANLTVGSNTSSPIDTRATIVGKETEILITSKSRQETEAKFQVTKQVSGQLNIGRDSVQHSILSTATQVDIHVPLIATNTPYTGSIPRPMNSNDNLLSQPIPSTNVSSTNVLKPRATIAHAISFLNCGASLIAKYKDAMLVLRHSIHRNSFWSRNSTSQYSYKMYAFVNSDPTKKCTRYTEWLQRMGYTPLILPNPVNVSAIQNKFFRETIDRTGVAGSSELIKLYLYTLTEHPIAVHWDIDVIVLKPMDNLFDAMLFDKDSPEGMRARSRLKIQQPLHQRLPDRIDAFFTRDIALATPWDIRQVAQGGFLVARPDMATFQRCIDVVMEANYSARCDHTGGWGRMGYGCKQGAMHFQGVVAYFYDQIAPGRGHGVELDVCAWNQIGHSVIYHGKKEEWQGTCRQGPIYGGNMSMNRPEYGACHDCRVFPVEETYTVHYTACSKPWQCRHKEQNISTAMTASTNSSTCGSLMREFYRYREDLEQELQTVIEYPMGNRRSNAFYPDIFLGYCMSRHGEGFYRAMADFPTHFEMKMIYGF